MNTLYLYIIAELLNVIIATMKYVVTVKSGPIIAGIVNTISSVFGYIVIKLLTDQSMTIIIVVTILTNLIGVPLGKIILSKFEKEKLFIFNATVKCDNIHAIALREYLKTNFDIHSTYNEIVSDQIYDFKIFSTSKTNSNIIKDYLGKFNAKYNIVESR